MVFAHELFADEFSNPGGFGDVGDFFVGEEKRRLGHGRHEQLQQQLRPLARLCRDRDIFDLFGDANAAKFLGDLVNGPRHLEQLRSDRLATRSVDLVDDDEELWRARGTPLIQHRFDDVAVPGSDRGRRVDDGENHVDAVGGRTCGLVQATTERRARTVQARRVDEDHLRVAFGEDSSYRVTRRVR